MKAFCRLIVLLLFLPLFCGCEKQNTSEPALTIGITQYWLGKDQGNRIGIRFSVNTEWSVSFHYADPQDRGWLYVTPGSGMAGEHSLTVTTTAVNTGAAVRKAYIDIVYGDAQTCRITVSQEG